jgi:hypothetical protein
MARKERPLSFGSAQLRWSGREVLATARGLNARCLALLREVSSEPHAGDAYSAVFGCQDLWKQLDPEACDRAGSSPVLLVNINLERMDWWDRIRGRHTVIYADPPIPLFATDRATGLVREILTEARSGARSQPHAARLAFGMSAFVSNAVANLSAADIDHIANKHGGQLRPRWDDRASFWRQLLEAAVGNDPKALAKVHLHCLQLLGRDLQLANI